MEFTRRIHPSIALESAIDKKKLNITMTEELRQILKDVINISYLSCYWYNLKYFVRAFHGVYRLYYKILIIYGNSSMARKFFSHNIVHEPRKIEENLRLFDEIFEMIYFQLCYIESVVCFKLDINMQNTISRLLHQTIKFWDTVLWVDDTSSKYTVNGLPIKYNFL